MSTQPGEVGRHSPVDPTSIAGASPARATDPPACIPAGPARSIRPAASPLNQLECFVILIEYLGDNPAGPYRAAAVARALTTLHQQPFAPARVWRWLQLLERRGWLIKQKCDLYPSGLFKTWGDKFSTRILFS